MDTRIGGDSFYKRFIAGRRELIITALYLIVALIVAAIEYGVIYSIETLAIVIGLVLSIRFLLGVLLIGESVLRRIRLPVKELLIVPASGAVLLMLKWIWEFDFLRIWKVSAFLALVIFAMPKILVRRKDAK